MEEYIEKKSGGMIVIKNRYIKAIEDIITINELNNWVQVLEDNDIKTLLNDIELYYKIEMNILQQ